VSSTFWRRHDPWYFDAMRLLTLAFVVVVSLGGTGCRFGSAHFDSTVSGRAFDPGGTVFSYIDATDDNLVVDDNPRLAVAMTWIIFDPNGDLNDLDGSALADYSHELKLRDALTLIFDAQGDVKPGAKFQSVVAGDLEQNVDGGFTTKVHLAPERLNGQSTYAAVIPFSSTRTTDVTINDVDFADAQPVVVGDVNIAFTRAETDPGDAREGTFKGTFQAPIVGERVAEENLALLDVQDVMALPLAKAAP
jgi:hypothetical protein